MPKIVVYLSDPQEQEHVCSGLRLETYDVVAFSPAEAELPPRGLAAALAQEQADVIILEYNAEDAYSVKMLQAAIDHDNWQRFLFILPDGIPVAHILMAVNEGASAILERPVDLKLLVNYVQRALKGPSRFRHEIEIRNDTVAACALVEKEVAAIRTQMTASRKLIAYLLSTPVAAQSRTVLVVSDSPYQLEHLRKLLEEHGFRVVVATNSEEGLQVAFAEKPRTVISDLELAGKNGMAFCHELKFEHKFTPCFFVICTANREKIEAVMAPGSGVDGCVIKSSTESGSQELIATLAMGLLL